MLNNKDAFDLQEMSKGLLMQWLDKKEVINDKDKNVFFELGCDCLNDTGILYKIYKAVTQKQEFIDDAIDLILSFEDKKANMVYGDKKVELELILFSQVISGLIDIMEDILPLGTVVDLKKQYFQKHLQANEIENIRVVITHRFLYHKEGTTYFPYAGVVYPVGMFENEIIHFTPSLIDKVVHKGYSDIQDDAYVYMMKRELILEKGMHSYGFSSAEERIKLQARMEVSK